jgi:hypothetical protein
MPNHTIVNLEQVEDFAPKFGMGDGLEAHFAKGDLGLERTGTTLFRYAPGYRVPFGHRHNPGDEEFYVVVSGSVRAKIEDEVVDLGQWDTVRVDGESMRCIEAGPDGAVVLAAGVSTTQESSEIVPGWWKD